MRDFLLRLKLWIAMRSVFYLARWAATGVHQACNRTEFVWGLGGRLELLVRFRRLKEPDGWTREEVVKMLEQARAAERQMRWKAPDPGGPKVGKLIVDGEPVDVLYWGAYPVVSDGPTLLGTPARLVVSVDAEGTSRVVQSDDQWVCQRCGASGPAANTSPTLERHLEFCKGRPTP